MVAQLGLICSETADYRARKRVKSRERAATADFSVPCLLFDSRALASEEGAGAITKVPFFFAWAPDLCYLRGFCEIIVAVRISFNRSLTPEVSCETSPRSRVRRKEQFEPREKRTGGGI